MNNQYFQTVVSTRLVIQYSSSVGIAFADDASADLTAASALHSAQTLAHTVELHAEATSSPSDGDSSRSLPPCRANEFAQQGVLQDALAATSGVN